ncbi:MAG: ISL3 family transposase [Bdellovibrionota bacterium]
MLTPKFNERNSTVMPVNSLTQSLLLPELKFIKLTYSHRASSNYHVEKVSEAEVCPKCATLSKSVYDRRLVKVKDSPVRDKMIFLEILKRRFWCEVCERPFTEPVPGITKGHRTTQRLKRAILWACENFVDLERVQRTYRVSAGYVFKTLYDQLEIELKRKINYPWPSTIGIDEHSFRRNKKFGFTEYASVIVDYKNKRPFELVEGKTGADLESSLAHIEGRENVSNVILDMCDAFKGFAKEFFPNAKVIADKFHVLRLLTPAINRRRKELAGDRRKNPIGRLLLKNGYKLEYFKQKTIWFWLEDHPELKEIYSWKERMHLFYRIKGFERAAKALTAMTDEMANSEIKEIKTLRKTLMKWRNEILAYFETGLTNARTEGFNNLAKLVQRRAFGYRSFRNYRLRFLNACA